jgi:hypothetical protein
MSLSFTNQCLIVNVTLAGAWVIGGRRQFTKHPLPALHGIASSTVAGWFLCFIGAALIGAPLDLRTALWATTAATVAIFPVASIVGTPHRTSKALGLWPLVLAAIGDSDFNDHDQGDGGDGGNGGGGEGGMANDNACNKEEGEEEEASARLLTVPSGLALIGGWTGAILLPLDWGTVWQEWPRASIVGTLLGALFGFGLLAIFLNFSPNKKKI